MLSRKSLKEYHETTFASDSINFVFCIELLDDLNEILFHLMIHFALFAHLKSQSWNHSWDLEAHIIWVVWIARDWRKIVLEFYNAEFEWIVEICLYFFFDHFALLAVILKNAYIL